MRGDTAGDTLQRGRQADSAGEYEVALRLYQQGIAKLLTEAKRVGTSNAGRRRTLESSAHDYLNRAEQLKQHLAANASRRSGGGGGAATRRGGGGASSGNSDLEQRVMDETLSRGDLGVRWDRWPY